MDKFIEMFEQDRQLLLLVFLFLVLLGVSLHLHGDAAADAQLIDLTRWTREATAGVLGAILLRLSPAKAGDGK